ncbi:MAG: NADPH-dependent 7-cyano-7-deazaguanine reductase QueF [Deltaproteobacteria bacterium]|nr:NADPH-dependent 7-cyano-7-deazaguanine reductase QueF [Deltaproteobacteria bacterium]
MENEGKNQNPEQPDPNLLAAIPREPRRREIGISEPCPFQGWDIWTAYELSWLDPQGKPRVAVATLIFPVDSPRLIESKSLKLYLNTFNQARLENLRSLQTMLQKDLGTVCGRPVEVILEFPEQFLKKRPLALEGDCLDDQDVEVMDYQVNPDLLKTGGGMVEETLTSRLFKSNCPLSGLPDWADIQVRYRGPKIEAPGLLRYLISFRQHRAFHENCVERIYMDIMRRCRPEKLTVYARYTRRGGLDINPFRTNYETRIPPNIPTARQ